MVKLPQIPNLPPKEELEFKEKAFLLEAREQFRQTSKKWYYALLTAVILSIPLGFILRRQIASYIISRYQPPVVNQNLYHALDLKTAEVDFIPVSPGLFSAYAHVFNPNADLSARSFDYEFSFKNQNGQVYKTAQGQSFLLPGASRFVIVPAVAVAETPTEINFTAANPRWTRAALPANPEFTVLQPRWGDSDGKFFVEALVKNPYSFIVSKVNVSVVIFDRGNREVLGANHTVLDDLEPLETRYFRVLWPRPQAELFTQSLGQIQIRAEINPLDPQFNLEDAGRLPSR